MIQKGNKKVEIRGVREKKKWYIKSTKGLNGKGQILKCKVAQEKKH